MRCLFVLAYGVQRCHVRSFLSRRPSSLKGVHRKQQGYTTPTTKGLLPARPAFTQFLDLTTYIHRWGYSDLPLCCAELTQYRSHPTGLALSMSSKYVADSNGVLIITASVIMSGVRDLSTFAYYKNITIEYNRNVLVLMIRSMLQNCCTYIKHREMRFYACSYSLRLPSLSTIQYIRTPFQTYKIGDFHAPLMDAETVLPILLFPCITNRHIVAYPPPHRSGTHHICIHIMPTTNGPSCHPHRDAHIIHRTPKATISRDSGLETESDPHPLYRYSALTSPQPR